MCYRLQQQCINNPLRSCGGGVPLLAGKLQEPGQLLDPNDKDSRGKDKKDIIIRVPALKLSMVMQRLIDQERSQAAASKQALADEVQAAATLQEAKEAAAQAVAVE